jgi:hypothetical protein
MPGETIDPPAIVPADPDPTLEPAGPPKPAARQKPRCPLYGRAADAV